MSVLLVEDCDVTRDMLSSICENLNVPHLVAESGKEALAICDKHPIELVVTGLDMPSMDGMELRKAIGERHPDIAVFCFMEASAKYEDHELQEVFASVSY